MSLQAAIVDLDGTVYRGGSVVPGASEAIETLRGAGIDVLFFSNNPTKTPAEYVDTLAAFDIEADAGSILTAGVVTELYLRERYPDEPIFLLGEDGLRRQFDGLTLTEDPEAATVVVGSIDRDLTYSTLATGLEALETGAKAFIGTDPDGAIPNAGGSSIPGSGAVIAALATAADRDPDVVLGKPNEYAVQTALDRLGVPAEACLVIGDRLDTDIAMGGRNGMQTALVRTGTHSGEDIDYYPDTPDYVFDSIADVENILGGDTA